MVPTDRFTIDPLERAEVICAELGIPFVRVDSDLRAAASDEAPLFVLSDYTHFDEYGHRVLAQSIAKSGPMKSALEAR